MSGFEFHETMAGSFRLRGEARDRPMSFTVRARSPRWLAFLRRPEVEIEGEIDAEGFADHRHMRGTMGLDAIRTRTLPYAFRFVANDGAPYSFVGKKDLHLARMVESMTVLPGAILDASGASVAEALLRFDLRSDLARFLWSFKLA
ncbi:MAG: hypothetical protein QM820_59190 [Minicystis sp.]